MTDAKATQCTFCDIHGGALPADTVYADPDVVAFLDVRPVFKGHVLVVPREHYVTLADLPASLLAPFFAVVQRVSVAVPAALGAQGTFVAMNNVVSQSVPHLHAHVIPRTKGDGLRGFFWPRLRYESAQESAEYADRIRAELPPDSANGEL
ncbi:MAG TPA: HIT family protein [Streptosporangiaceae bacterium]|nr:HIT family protein [Streptosporangiaceae bacterium]